MNSHSRYRLFLVGLLWSALFLISPPEVNAGSRIGRAPIALGSGDGLLGYWSFDGAHTAKNGVGILTTYDLSGQNSHATSTGVSTGPLGTFGKIGQAMQFDGTDDFMRAGTPGTTTRKSICAWIYPGALSVVDDEGFIISKTEGNGAPGWLFSVQSAAGPVLRFNQNWSPNQGQWDAPANSIVLNTWQHVCALYDLSSSANEAQLFINGVSQAITETGAPSGSAMDAPTQQINIGRQSSGQPFYFNGKIDDLRLYNRILSNDEVKRLYKMGATAKTGVVPQRGTLADGLVGYWTFDGKDTTHDSRGYIAEDRSGNANNGLAGSAPFPKRALGKLGQGIEFVVGSDHLDTGAGDGSVLDLPGNMTACAWAYARSVPNGSEAVIIANNNATKVQYSFEIEGDRAVGLFWQEDDTNEVRELVTGAAAISFNTWNHLCAVRVGAGVTGTIYINGAAQSTTVDAGPVEVSTFGNTLIGDGNIGGPQEWDGFIDDVRLYNRVLSADEIKRLSKMGSTAKVGVAINNGSLAQGLVVYYPLNGPDLSGVAVYDRSGQGNNGTTGTTTYAIGKIGQGVGFNGVDSALATNSGIDLSATRALSVSLWLYQSVPFSLNDGLAFEVSTNAQVATDGLLVDPNSSSGNGVTVLLNGDVGLNYAEYTVPTNNAWHHYVVIADKSRSANEVDLYIDGVLQTPNARPVNSDNTNTFGNQQFFFMARAGIALFNTGTLDDIRVYNRVLSADEIKRLYNLGR